jgi:transcriptional regulator with XRE-family HTH domain
MKVESRLKALLSEHNLDRHGIIQEIATGIGVNRHTIAKLYNDRTPSVSFSLLGRLCNWLTQNGVPPDELPGALFGSGRAPLWNAIARQGGDVTVYLGEYQPITEGEVVWRWISRRDSAVASLIIQRLSTGSEGGARPPRLNFQYIPFRYSPADPIVDPRLLEKDIDRTRSVFEQTQQDVNPGTAIVIGSQRVNYLLEFFMADLFGCRPFALPPGEPRVPFFSVYRQSDQNTPSCFGGRHNPFRRKDSDQPGLHYLSDKGHWVTCPWVREEQDAGIVVSLKDHRRKSATLAIFGFSGRATEAVGEQLTLREDLFWPPAVKLKTKDIGVFVCRLTYSPSGREEDLQGRVQMNSCDVIPVAPRTLERFLHR